VRVQTRCVDEVKSQPSNHRSDDLGKDWRPQTSAVQTLLLRVRVMPGMDGVELGRQLRANQVGRGRVLAEPLFVETMLESIERLGRPLNAAADFPWMRSMSAAWPFSLLAPCSMPLPIVPASVRKKRVVSRFA
jgi:hypothetical protein